VAFDSVTSEEMIMTEAITVDFEPKESGASASDLLRATADQLVAAQNWEALEWICAHPLAPEDVLLKLAHLPVDRLLSVLGHRSGPPSLLEFLADRREYLEAVVTLAIQKYRSQSVSADEFRAFLQRHWHNYSMLKALLYEQFNDDSKSRIVEEACRQHPQADDLMELRARLTTIQRAASSSLEPEIRTLYEAADPKVQLALAGNPHTPTDLLEHMLSAKAIENANRIRHAAMLNLSARRE
jgi:hypothetical protein